MASTRWKILDHRSCRQSWIRQEDSYTSRTTCKHGTIVGILIEIFARGGVSTRISLTIFYRETTDVLAPQRAEMVTPLVIHGTPSIELFWFCDNSPSLIRHPFLFEFSLHGRGGGGGAGDSGILMEIRKREGVCRDQQDLSMLRYLKRLTRFTIESLIALQRTTSCKFKISVNRNRHRLQWLFATRFLFFLSFFFFFF